VRSLTAAMAAALVLVPAAPAWAAGQPPVAVDDAVTYRNTGGTTYLVDALQNDTDPDGDTLTYAAVGTATKGNAYLSAGKLFYKPSLGSTGTDSFTYTVSDGQGNTATGTVTATLWVDPAAPTGVSIDGGFGTTAVVLTWGAPARATSYRIYRNGVLVGETSDVRFVDGSLSATEYRYEIAALNGGGFEGPRSTPVYRMAQLPTPTGLTVDVTRDPTTLYLSWAAGGQAGPWVVWLNGIQLATTSTPTFWHRGLVTGNQYSYRVQVASPSTTTVVYPPSLLSAAVSGTPVVLTDIGELFLDLGGRAGDLGPVTVAERAVEGGRQQDHLRGLIVQQDGEQPMTVRTDIATAYLTTGGVAGDLGFPVVEQECGRRDGGCLQLFEFGSIWALLGTVTRVIALEIEEGWAAAGWDQGPLGYPIGDQIPLRAGGIGQAFEDGAVYYSTATGSHGVSGYIFDRFAAARYENGPLGYPTSDEIALNEGSAQLFQGGTIWRWAYGQAHVVGGAIRAKWAAGGYENGQLGYPWSDEVALRGGVAQVFQRGTMYWSPATGAHPVFGAIRNAYAASRYENGPLGYPVADEVALRGGYAQVFQGGTIYWSFSGGAHAVRGAIRGAWAAQGWENGWLGYPVSDEVALRGGGVAQVFSGGTIYWSAATGAHVVSGAIRQAYGNNGWENGRLGYPVSDEYGAGGRARRQDFQGGSITVDMASGRVSVTFR
jgi:uncharacterized protein with LGFP repeats